MLAGRGGGDGCGGGRLFELPPIRDVIGNLDFVTACTITDDEVAQGLLVVVVTVALEEIVGYGFVGGVGRLVEPLVMPCF